MSFFLAYFFTVVLFLFQRPSESRTVKCCMTGNSYDIFLPEHELESSQERLFSSFLSNIVKYYFLMWSSE